MVMTKSIFLAGAAACAILAAAPASAAPIAENISFSVSGLNSITADPQSPDPVTGSFDLTLDSATDYSAQTVGITLKNLNIDLGSALSFDYNSTTDLLIVGGIDGAPTCTDGPSCIQILPADNDFYLQIKGLTTASPTIVNFGFAQTSAPDDYFFYNSDKPGTLTIGPIVTTTGGGVPEPATWIAMLAGFFMIGIAVSSRKISLSAV